MIDEEHRPDYLFDPNGCPPDPSVAVLEASLRPLVASPPALPSLPKRKTTKVPNLMTITPAVPESARTSLSRQRAVVFGSIALAATATLAAVWAMTHPPASPNPGAEASPTVMAVTAPPPMDGPIVAAQQALVLRGPDAGSVSQAELVVLPTGAGFDHLVRDQTQVVFSRVLFDQMRSKASTMAGGTVMLHGGMSLGGIERFDLSLAAGEYVACGMTTSLEGQVASGCVKTSVAVDRGPLSVTWIPLGRYVETEAPSVPDLSDPFAGKTRDTVIDPRSGLPRPKKTTSQPNLKDPFGGRSSAPKAEKKKKKSVASPNLKDPFSKD